MKKRVWICRSCGYISGEWIGKCPSCEEWNSMEDRRIPIVEVERSSTENTSPIDMISEKAVWEGTTFANEMQILSTMEGTAQMMNCYKCHLDIPPVSEYCPYCGIKLYTICPKCKNKYSSEYSFCFLCGTRSDANKKEYEQNETRDGWRCDVCGYVHYDKVSPAECPRCHVIVHKRR